MLKNNFFIQILLTLLYLIGFFDLFNNTLKDLYLIETPLRVLIPYFFIFEKIFKLKLINVWLNPNNIFIFVYLVFKLFITKSIIKLPNILKYNLLFLLVLLVTQRIISMYLDTFFNNDIVLVNNSLFRQNIYLNNNFLNLLTFQKFLIFFFLYVYLYITSLFNKYPNISFLKPLTDSIAFWLRFKTPSMKIGKF